MFRTGNKKVRDSEETEPVDRNRKDQYNLYRVKKDNRTSVPNRQNQNNQGRLEQVCSEHSPSVFSPERCDRCKQYLWTERTNRSEHLCPYNTLSKNEKDNHQSSKVNTIITS